MAKCEYCNKEYDNLTNEHIFPNFFYEILGLKNNQVKYLSFNRLLLKPNSTNHHYSSMY